MKSRPIIAYKRLCANHGVKALCVINDYLLCASFGNIIKIINLKTIDILLEFVVSCSSNIYGLLYKECKDKNETGILVAYCVHKIYCFSLQTDNNAPCLQLISKYCINKWIVQMKFLPCDIKEKLYETENGERNKPQKQAAPILALCLSNGCILFLNIYTGIYPFKFKFKGIHLLYSADVYIKETKRGWSFLVAGGTPFNNILLWKFKTKNIHEMEKIYKKNKKKEITTLKHAQELIGHRGIIFKVKFFDKNRYILSASDDREGRVWKIDQKTNVNEEKNVVANKTKIERIGTNDHTDSVSKKKTLSYKCKKVLTGHGARIWDVDMCSYDKTVYFITCSDDASCNIYEEKKKNYYQIFNYYRSTVRCVSFHRKWKLVISGCDNGALYICSIPTCMSGNHVETNGTNQHDSSNTLIQYNEIKRNSTKHDGISMSNFSKGYYGDADYMSKLKDVSLLDADTSIGGNDNKSNRKINGCLEEVELKDESSSTDFQMFMSDCMKDRIKENDWIRSIHHITIYDFLICTNLGCIFTLHVDAERRKMQVSLVYEEKQKENLTTYLTFFGKEYICLGFANGYCCFLFFKGKEEKDADFYKREQHICNYFKCFSHRISAMCLLPLSGISYDVVIKNKGKNSVLDVSHIYIKKEKNMNENIYHKDIQRDSDSYKFDFYHILYNHKTGEGENGKTQNQNGYYNEKFLSMKKEQLGKTFFLCNIDYAGNIKIFLIQNKQEEVDIKDILETEIDVKNKKSRIISMNYLIRQKRENLGVLFFIGDEYGCIFIIYVKIPIQIKTDKQIEYDFNKTHVKCSDKIRVHNNRKVFDIQFIENFIYSCGKNGNIIKYQLFKNKDRIYTLHKLYLIKITYYSSIYKIIPLNGNYLDLFQEKKKKMETENNCLYHMNGQGETNTERNNNERENIFVCCFKEKKFVLYDLKHKVEYISVVCGGFRRPLTILINPNEHLMKTFSFAFCKEKNIYFSFKTLMEKEKETVNVPYQKLNINAGFHNKNVSFFMWINSKYLCTCSEDGTIKIIKTQLNSAKHHVDKGQERTVNDLKLLKNTMYKCIKTNKSFLLNDKNISKYLLKNKSISKKKNSKQNGHVLQHRMNIIQTVYNHSEPIFHMTFLNNPDYFSKRLKLIITVGAKNSANLFYLFHDIHKTPILFHFEKLKIPIFSSNLRLLCVQGAYDVLTNQYNKCTVKMHIFIGTSIGYIFNYSGIYEFALFQNIVLPKVIKRTSLVDSYNMNSTIWSMCLKWNTTVFSSTRNTAKKTNSISGEGCESEKERKEQKKKEQTEKEQRRLVQCSIEQKNWEGSVPLYDESRFFFTRKEKRKKNKPCANILFCGLGCGVLQIWHCYVNNAGWKWSSESPNGVNPHEKHTENKEMQLIPLKKLNIHQNGINEICVTHRGELLYVFTCGDDQSIHVLLLKIKNKRNNIYVMVLQSTSLTNAHMSSLRSIKCIFPFILTVAWDQYISIWKIEKTNEKKNKTAKTILTKKGQIKMAVYDVCCLNVFKCGNKTLKQKRAQITEDHKNQNKTERKFYKFDVGVSGASGSVELFRIKIVS